MRCMTSSKVDPVMFTVGRVQTENNNVSHFNLQPMVDTKLCPSIPKLRVDGWTITLVTQDTESATPKLRQTRWRRKSENGKSGKCSRVSSIPELRVEEMTDDSKSLKSLLLKELRVDNSENWWVNYSWSQNIMLFNSLIVKSSTIPKMDKSRSHDVFIFSGQT